MITPLQERRRSLMLHVYGKTRLYKRQIEMQPESTANSQSESKDEIHPFMLQINKRQGNFQVQFIGNHPAARRSLSLSSLYSHAPAGSGKAGPRPRIRLYLVLLVQPPGTRLFRAGARGRVDKRASCHPGCFSPSTAQPRCPRVLLTAQRSCKCFS